MRRWCCWVTLEESRPAIDTHRLGDVILCVQLCRVCLEFETHLPSITITLIEARTIVAGHVPIATHLIVDVLAECRSISSILATAEAKFRGRHEILAKEKTMRPVGRQKCKAHKSFYVPSTRVALRTDL